MPERIAKNFVADNPKYLKEKSTGKKCWEKRLYEDLSFYHYFEGEDK